MQSMLLYGDVNSGASVFDFVGMPVERAYWMAQTADIVLALLDLAAPCLGWADWEREAARLKARFEPLRTQVPALRSRQDVRQAVGARVACSPPVLVRCTNMPGAASSASCRKPAGHRDYGETHGLVAGLHEAA
jgi:hypothetical protein